MQSILIIDTPKNCKECPLSYWGIDGENCKPMRRMTEDEKPTWCPLRPLPKKAYPEFPNSYEYGYADGWNACLDAITGETE